MLVKSSFSAHKALIMTQRVTCVGGCKLMLFEGSMTNLGFFSKKSKVLKSCLCGHVIKTDGEPAYEDSVAPPPLGMLGKSDMASLTVTLLSGAIPSSSPSSHLPLILFHPPISSVFVLPHSLFPG